MSERWTNDLRTAAEFVASIETDDCAVNLELGELAERIRVIAERFDARPRLRPTDGDATVIHSNTGT